MLIYFLNDEEHTELLLKLQLRAQIAQLKYHVANIVLPYLFPFQKSAKMRCFQIFEAFLNSSKILIRAEMLDLIPVNDTVRRSAVQISKSKVADDKATRSRLIVAD